MSPHEYEGKDKGAQGRGETDGVEPVVVDRVRVLAARELDGPLAALAVCAVLPCRLDALLEHVVVR